MASATIISLLIVVDESADTAQYKQDGVTRCRRVIVNDMVLKTLGVGDKLDKLDMDKELKTLKEGDKLNLVAGESILMTLRRDAEVDKPDRPINCQDSDTWDHCPPPPPLSSLCS